ncbi:MAG: di-trans,poly-cis-decaprenylcistransferase [Candidatus Rokubacteria bacterium]|nr:di-trans,poly-cis-decaprenylcistransferase [Candidatus Rokubacteria bacterium]
MDGNGRWARARSLPRIAGHREGVKAARSTVRAAARIGIEYLTLYAFSAENWTRPVAEVEFLMRLLESSVDEELPELIRNNVRLRILGEMAPLSPGVRQSIQRAVAATEADTGLTLLIALNYGGRQELMRAIRAIAARVVRGELRPDAIEEADVAASLDTAGVPDPDLLIRTSGEFRLSNFLLWQVAYTELLILPTLWPDFSPRDLYLAVADYQRRSRRFGGL